MKKPSPAMLAIIAIVVSIAVALHLYLWLEPACTLQSRRIVMKASGGVGCVEFWLNRYQTLLTGILAIAGAAGTIMVTRHQMHGEAERRRRHNYLNIVSELRRCRNQLAEAYTGAIAFGTPMERSVPIPTLSFNRQPIHIADIPADEALLLFLLADEIDLEIDFLNTEYALPPDDMSWERAQTCALLSDRVEETLELFEPMIGLDAEREPILSGEQYDRAVLSARARKVRRFDPMPQA